MMAIAGVNVGKKYILFYFTLAVNKNRTFYRNLNKNNINISVLTEAKNYRASLSVPGTIF